MLIILVYSVDLPALKTITIGSVDGSASNNFYFCETLQLRGMLNRIEVLSLVDLPALTSVVLGNGSFFSVNNLIIKGTFTSFISSLLISIDLPVLKQLTMGKNCCASVKGFFGEDNNKAEMRSMFYLVLFHVDLPELTEITLLENALQNMVEMRIVDVPALNNADMIKIESGVLVELKSLKYGEGMLKNVFDSKWLFIAVSEIFVNQLKEITTAKASLIKKRAN